MLVSKNRKNDRSYVCISFFHSLMWFDRPFLYLRHAARNQIATNLTFFMENPKKDICADRRDNLIILALKQKKKKKKSKEK